MSKLPVFSCCFLLLVAAALPIAAGGPGLPGGGSGPDDEGFVPCPTPACMAPCQFPPEPQGLCKAPDGAVGETSFFCCCCGGSDGAFKFFSPTLEMDRAADVATLTWTGTPGAQAYDIVGGDLDLLRAGGGDYSLATTACVENDNPATTQSVPGTPDPGKARWFVIRGDGAAGGTYDATGSAAQAGWRDVEIAGSDQDCPTMP